MKLPMTLLVRYLFFFNAFVLAVFGGASFLRVDPNPGMNMGYKVYAILFLGDALAMLLCGLLINRKFPVVFWISVTVLSLNIILTIFDQFGLIDLFFATMNISTLGSLLFLRKEFLTQ